MKKLVSLVLAGVLLLAFGVFALGSSEDSETVSQQSGTATKEETTNTLGDYKIEIQSCRLAKDYEKKDVAIVTYSFTNEKNDTPTAFFTAFEDQAYQNGVGLNEAYIIDDSYSYNNENATKEIKKGATIDVEVAYTLNDATTPIEVEISELFSFSDKTITKTFEIK